MALTYNITLKKDLGQRSEWSALCSRNIGKTRKINGSLTSKIWNPTVLQKLDKEDVVYIYIGRDIDIDIYIITNI